MNGLKFLFFLFVGAVTVTLVTLAVSLDDMKQRNRNMQNFYDCVKSDIESKRYSTMDSIECHCNTILKTEYGNTCK